MRSLLILIFFNFLSTVLFAQFCSGTLGDNIFVEGNFGSGAANLLSPDPSIAPGYIYTFNVPPQDGEYVLTNGTGSWSGLYPSWLVIGDNSSDPNGYMMVVNASNSPGLFYEQTIDGLCENTLYEFSADIINLIRTGVANHIDPDVSFLINGVELFTTGTIPKTNNWTTYGFTFTTEIGQQSLTLSLRNNAPGGNGNDLALDNISFKACGPETSIFPETDISYLCEDNAFILQALILGNQYSNPSIQWQQSIDFGTSWQDIPSATLASYTTTVLTAGNYYYRFLVADGLANLASEKCRVNSNVKVISVLPEQTMISDTICEGLTLMVGNSIYTESGVYNDTLENFLGCDSILITDLSVEIDTNYKANITINPPCEGENDGSIFINNVSGGIPPYNYFFDGLDVGGTTMFSNLIIGSTYSILITDDIGCPIEENILIESAANLILDLGDDQSVNLGESATITPIINFDPINFEWQTAIPVDCNDFDECLELDFQPTSSQFVYLELIDSSGCMVSDSVFIEVKDVREFWIPNAFSPNNDGLNDEFTVFGNPSNVKLVEDFKIFDRWGGCVYQIKDLEPNDLINGWDGTFNGRPLQVGVYIYTASIRFVDEQLKNYSGDVILMK